MKSAKTLVFSCVLCSLTSCSPLFAQKPRSLSLKEAIALAQAQSPLQRVAKARVEGANAQLGGAKALSNPVLSIAQPIGQNTGGLDEAVLITQSIEWGEKRHQHTRALNAERLSVVAEAEGIANDIQFNVQSAYFDALLADAEQKLAEESLSRTEAFTKAAEIQFQAGDVARSNVVRSRIELNRTQQALEVAKTEHENRYATLKSLLNLPSDSTLTLTETLSYVPLSFSEPLLWKIAQDQRADLRSARFTRVSREAALREGRVQGMPDLFLELRHSTLDPTKGGNSFRVGFTIPLFDYGRIRSEARVAKANLKMQEASLQEVERAAQLEVETAFRSWQLAKKTVESFQKGRLEQSKELMTMVQLGYEKGANSYLELLDAQTVYRTEQTDYLRALATYLTAKAALQRAVGGVLP